MLDHEKLTVYQASLGFLEWLNPIFEKTPKSLAVRDQLDRASTSIPLNTAEGNGKFTSADRCRFFDIARGSALECAACLDVLRVKNVIQGEEAGAGKQMIQEVVSMLVGLIKSQSPSRVYEASGAYEAGRD